MSGRAQKLFRYYRIFSVSLPEQTIKLRSHLRWSQTMCARRAGIYRSTLNRIERGVLTDVKLSTLLNLCVALSGRTQEGEFEPAHMVTLDQITGLDRPTKELVCATCACAIEGNLHRCTDCVLALSELGHGNGYIAAKLELPVRAVEVIIAEVREARRLKIYG